VLIAAMTAFILVPTLSVWKCPALIVIWLQLKNRNLREALAVNMSCWCM